MVPFAGYAMPVQYPAGLMAEHLHTLTAAGLFDVSHMGQLRLVGPEAAAAFETLMPVDVIGLPVGKQRYGLLLTDEGTIIDDLMFVNRGTDIFVIVNGACKVNDIAHIQARIGSRCAVIPCPERALQALQGPQAATALASLAPEVGRLVFMSGATFLLACGARRVEAFITRSGYTGEDGFEISVLADDATLLARALLAHPAVKPIGLGARNSLRLEAGLCLYGNDLDSGTTPAEAQLASAIQKVRRPGGSRAGGFPGADRVLAQLAGGAQAPARRRVGLRALFWTTFDWNKSFEMAVPITGLAYSGQYDFTETHMYWANTHMVQPAKDALQCDACHSAAGKPGRMDWKALGYAGDPIEWGGRK